MKYISVNDYLMGRVKLEDLSPELIGNVNTIVPKINELLEKFGEFRKCNSGYRSLEDQQRINPKALKSKHLTCQAIDLEDTNRKLASWCKQHYTILEQLGLYCEDFDHTPTWVHLQCVPPKSGKRVFIP